MIDGVVLQVPLLDVPWEHFAALVIAAAAGGAFGAAVGALPAFVFTGFVVLLGEGLAALAGPGTRYNELASAELASGVTGVVGFGPVTGPHVGFAAGVAATAYAAKRYPEMEPDWDYHFGKDILFAFGTKPDILAVGAAFGVLGMLIARLFGGLGVPIDGIAFSVVATAFLARLVFGYPLIGAPAGDGYFDMTPFERDELRDDGSERPAVEPWLPQQYRWSGVAAIGLVGGVLGGWTWMITGTVFMAYGISAASLLFLNLGVANFPVTHHITLGGSTFAVVAGAYAVSEPTLMVVAALGGLVGALLGEVTQRVAYAHSGTHVDPPAMSIAIYTLVIGVLFLLGVLPNAGYLAL
ncbi:hypothetical protein SAMN05216559_3085 [Halomicrobium zhouii]|uniref:DUF7973 domain-containing protein n=1 Tax=Halomicrobium zhouii TaxID=767519 RepID=A0A1I6LTH9_9EURY|nr:hypothetical protein [Halomicrobium zhouii]SFS06716.1 hypothetical protein SAMN05216559_3085 [Halomicrobium zhouii]